MSKVKQVKVALLALVAALVIAIPSMAFADDGDDQDTAADATPTYSITINGTATSHQYEAYQILKGDIDTTGKILTAIEFGDNIDSSKLIAAMVEAAMLTVPEGKTQNDITADDVAKALKDVNDKSDAANALADIVNKSLKGNAINLDPDGMTYSKTVEKAGYYLIKDKDDSLKGVENDAYTDFILQVVGAVQVSPKSTWPEVDKQVKEDSNNTWGEAGDFEVGQEIEYQLIATLPSADHFDAYKKYYINFNDRMDAGLEYIADSVKVTVDGDTNKDITNYFDISWNKTTGMLTIAAKANQKNTYLLEVPDVAAGKKIVVDYKAVITEDALVYGTPGYTNDVYLDFSNNPNQDVDGTPGDTGKTPKDYCVVFTYVADQTKIDGETKVKLSGAGFVLKRNSDNKYYTDKFNSDGTRVWVSAIDSVDIATRTSDGNGKFDFKGLDADSYTLIETVIPDGYNKVADIPFAVGSEVAYSGENYDGTATGTDNSADKILTKLTISINGAAADNGNAGTGTVAQTVENMPGRGLPSTGGIGTTIFYVVGGTLVLAALIAMVVRRRRSATTA